MLGHVVPLLLLIRLVLITFSVIMGGLVTLTLAYCLWLLLVAALRGHRLTRPRLAAPVTRFAIVIPAHNEELVIAATLGWLGSADYPQSLRSTVIVADNCSDGTVEIARRFPGVTVVERTDVDLPGKPAALNWALAQSVPEIESADAVVIMDADTQMDTNFLAVMDGAYQSSLPGAFAAQGRYDVLNPEDGWRTALMAGALSLVHVVRPLAREALRLSVGLKGNGMCFSRGLLREIPWNPASLTEDIELGLDLIVRKGVRTVFVPNAVVSAQMPASAGAAASQRKRWEGGRSRIVRERAVAMLVQGLTRRDRVFLDVAIDLLAPPLANLAAMLLLWGVAIAGLIALGWLNAMVYACWWAGAAAALIVYVVGGFKVGGAPAGSYRALIQAPFYMIWKIFSIGTRRKPVKDKGGDAWIRTERTPIVSDAPADIAAHGGPGGLA